MTSHDKRLQLQSDRRSVAIIGGGPAGLTAAYCLQKRGGQHPIVLEETSQVGGIARTEVYKGYRFDIGGHRFFTKVEPVQKLWKEVLPNDFLRRPRMSRIYYRGKYFSYPLKVFNALNNMGIYESARIMLSYLKWKVRPHTEEENFEQWVTNRFGGRLFWHFFKAYTEKVWGIPCKSIRADWAAQRIQNLSLRKAVWNAVSGSNNTSSLIDAFDYPRLGPGMMWEAFRDRIEAKGGEIRMNSRAARIIRTDDRVLAIEVAREYRHAGLARHLTARAIADPATADELLLAFTLPDAWDTAHERLSPAAYGARLAAFLGAQGFCPTGTDEPEVLFQRDAALLVRRGDRAPAAVAAAFEQARYLGPAGRAERDLRAA